MSPTKPERNPPIDLPEDEREINLPHPTKYTLYLTEKINDTIFDYDENEREKTIQKFDEIFRLGVGSASDEENKIAICTRVDLEQRSPLAALIISGNQDLIPKRIRDMVLSDRRCLRTQDITLETPLHIMARNPTEIPRFLTLADIDAEAIKPRDLVLQNMAGYTPIECAAQMGQIRIFDEKGKNLAVKALLTEIPNPETLGATQITVLDQALEEDPDFRDHLGNIQDRLPKPQKTRTKKREQEIDTYFSPH